MRLLLAMSAMIGLLLSPAAASAAAMQCAHEHGAADMAMNMPMADADMGAQDHSCCDDKSDGFDEGASSKHDAKACAQACATMCAVVAALPVAPPLSVVISSSSELRPAIVAGLHPFAPPGLERPPKPLA